MVASLREPDSKLTISAHNFTNRYIGVISNNVAFMVNRLKEICGT